MKNKEVIDTLVKIKSKVVIDEYLSYFVKCLTQASNFKEIVRNIDSLEASQLRLPNETCSDILMCFIDYDDWTNFKKYFILYYEGERIVEASFKKIITALVDKQNLELVRFVITVSMTGKSAFSNLKLTETQYKFIILALLKTQLSLNSKLTQVKAEAAHSNLITPNIGPKPGMALSTPTSLGSPKKAPEQETQQQPAEPQESHLPVPIDEAQESKSVTSGFISVKQDVDEDEDFFEIIDEAMIERIIKEIRITEKKEPHHQAHHK